MSLKLSKRAITIITVCFLTVFLASVILVMAAVGKIDVSGVPVLGRLFTSSNGAPNVTISTDGAVKNLSATPSNAYTSPNSIKISDDGFAFVGDETGMKVFKINLSTGATVATYSSSEKINNVFLNNGKVYVLEGSLAGKLTVLNTSLSGAVTVNVDHTPSDMAITGTTAYVANRFSNTVSVVNLSTNKVTKEIPVSREPIGVELVGTKLFVVSHLTDDAANEDVVSSKVIVIDTTNNTVIKTIPLVNGTTNVKDICATPDGKTLYVSHIVGRYAYPTSQTDRGWITTNCFTVLDAQKMEVTATVLLDEVDLGAANPWGVSVSEDAKKLVVSLSGTHEVMVIDIQKLNSKISAVKAGNGLVSDVNRIVDYFPFLDDARERIELPGKGPRPVQISDGKAYIGQYFTGNIAVVDLSNNSVTQISLGEQPVLDAVRTGEMVWNDAGDSYQKWLSCASCHTADARSGALSWDEMNDGIGNEKSTKSLVYAHRTPPTMHTAISATGEDGVAGSYNYVISDEDLVCVNAYLKSLLPVASPYLNRDGTLTESASRGKALFEDKGCVSCHPAPLYTNMKQYDSDTITKGWDRRPLDTPTLVEIWRSGPYFYNGKAATIDETVKHKAPKLTDNELNDLTNFVLSIGAEGEEYGVEQLFITNPDGSEGQSALVPGSTINYFTVRKQTKDNIDAKVVFTLVDNKGKELFKSEKELGKMNYNTVVSVNIKDGIEINTNIPKGSYFKVSILDSQTNNPIATDYILKY